MYAYLLE